MDKKKIQDIALSIDPIVNYYSPFDTRPPIRHWILLSPHKDNNILGKCSALPTVVANGGFGKAFDGPVEHVLVSDRNAITLSEQVSSTDNEALINQILQHEISHAKQSEKYMDAYKRR